MCVCSGISLGVLKWFLCVCVCVYEPSFLLINWHHLFESEVDITNVTMSLYFE